MQSRPKRRIKVIPDTNIQASIRKINPRAGKVPFPELIGYDKTWAFRIFRQLTSSRAFSIAAAVGFSPDNILAITTILDSLSRRRIFVLTSSPSRSLYT